MKGELAAHESLRTSPAIDRYLSFFPSPLLSTLTRDFFYEVASSYNQVYFSAIGLKRVIDLPRVSSETFQVYCSVNRTYERIIYSHRTVKGDGVSTFTLTIRIGAIYLRENICRARIRWRIAVNSIRRSTGAISLSDTHAERPT